MKTCLVRTAFVFVATMALGAPAFAQNTRSFVSGLGDDGDKCIRTAPCKPFAAAMAKTIRHSHSPSAPWSKTSLPSGGSGDYDVSSEAPT
jgi:hypothetical protein